jgi:hypothetical protein
MIKLHSRNGFWVLISIATLVLYLLPLVVHGEHNYIRVHDNLDITVSSLKILANSGMIFSDSMAIIPNMMGGLPRLVYGSEFNYLLWLFIFLKPFMAMMINEIIIHIVAYVSMVALLQKLLDNSEVEFKTAIIHVSALMFALIPFFPATGVGVALLPYVLLVFFKIRAHQQRWFDWVALVFIPFFSSFVLVYLFFLVISGCFFVGEMALRRKSNTNLLIAIMGLSTLFLLIEYRLVYEMFIGHDFISHRTEFVRKSVDLMGAYRGAYNVFLFGQSHSINLQFFYVLATLNLAILLTWVKSRLSLMLSLSLVILFVGSLFSGFWETILMSKYYIPTLLVITLISLRVKKPFWMMYAGVLLAIVCSLWYGLWYYQGWIELSHAITLFTLLDLSRFVLLLTPVWYVLFALACVVVIQKLRFGIVIVVIITLLQLNLAFEQAQFFPNSKGLTYEKFFDEPLFEEIKTTIAQPQSSYRVASVGIHPAVALYNGFYTLDGYISNYPISYKHTFTRLVEKNFSIYPNSRLFIENWGSKCYLIAGIYDVDEYVQGAVIDHFYFDAPLFYRMGGRYLFSGYQIDNAEENHLKLEKVFASPEGHWCVYLYKVEL